MKMPFASMPGRRAASSGPFRRIRFGRLEGWLSGAALGVLAAAVAALSGCGADRGADKRVPPSRVAPPVPSVVVGSRPSAGPDPSKPPDALRVETRWSQRFGGVDRELGQRIAEGADGEVFLTGNIVGSCDFGAGRLEGGVARSAFLAKLDAGGNALWSRVIAGAGHIDGLLAGGTPGAIIAGTFTKTISIGVSTLHSAGQEDVFLAKFDPVGGLQWMKRFGDPPSESAAGVAANAEGELFLIGSSHGAAELRVKTHRATFFRLNAFVAKFTASGEPLWRQQLGESPKGDLAIAVDRGGNAIIAGSFWRSPQDRRDPSRDDRDDSVTAIVSKLDPAGKLIWSKRFGESPSHQGIHVATDPSGNVLVAVNRWSDPGSQCLPPDDLFSAFAYDVLLTKLSPSGEMLWSKRFGDHPGEQSSLAINTDERGNVWIAGDFKGTIDFGGERLESRGRRDTFVALLGPSGEHLWSGRMGGTEGQQVGGAAATRGGSLLLVGSFGGTADFGTGPLTSAGMSDIFVAALGR